MCVCVCVCGGARRCLSQRHCLFCPSRERWECCPSGHSHRVQSAVGGRVCVGGGSPGAKVLHTVQFYAALLCSLRSPPPNSPPPPTVGLYSCMKNYCHSAGGWPPDPSQHGKVHLSAASYIKSASVMRNFRQITGLRPARVPSCGRPSPITLFLQIFSVAAADQRKHTLGSAEPHLLSPDRGTQRLRHRAAPPPPLIED